MILIQQPKNVIQVEGENKVWRDVCFWIREWGEIWGIKIQGSIENSKHPIPNTASRT